MGDVRRLIDVTSSSSSEDEEEDLVLLRRVKVYRTRQHCFTKYDDLDFFHRFRLTKPTILALLQQIAPLITFPTNRGGYIQPMDQLLLTLRFYATGSFLMSAGDFIGIGKSSSSRIIRRVSYAIASLRPQYIKMYSTDAELQRASEDFYRIANFPKVIGAIDCTLIKIDSVGGEDAEIYRSRKGFFSLNVQTICDANLKIKNIIARWPGSCHDQTIFNNSEVKQDFQNGRYGRYLLVGDSGYALEPYLMTKLHRVRTEAENLYNESLIRTRNAVERQYGVWKRRFPVLRLGMRLKLQTIMSVIIATAVLHNIAIDMHENIPERWLDVLEDNNEDEEDVALNGNLAVNAANVQQMIIAEHFGHL